MLLEQCSSDVRQPAAIQRGNRESTGIAKSPYGERATSMYYVSVTRATGRWQAERG